MIFTTGVLRNFYSLETVPPCKKFGNHCIRGLIHYLSFVDHSVPTTNASRPLKSSKNARFRQIYFERKNKEIAPCIFLSGPDDVIQISLDHHPLMTSPKKSSNPKVPEFLKIELRRRSASLEGVWTALWLYRLESYDWTKLRSLNGFKSSCSCAEYVSFNCSYWFEILFKFQSCQRFVKILPQKLITVKT